MSSDPHSRSPWFILFVLLIASVVAPLNQFKVPPVMPLLMNAFNLSASRAGLLMSIFAATGLVLAIPSGFIFQRLGYRITGLVAVGSVILGASLGALSTNEGMMLTSRVIEGLGMSFMTVVAPAVIAIWFSADERGTPMGLWATWVPLGSSLMFAIAPLLAGRWSWRAVWWAGSLFAGVAWLFYYLFIKSPPVQHAGADSVSNPERLTGSHLGLVLRNRDLWLISSLFCCFNLAFIAFVTWVPTFLNRYHEMSLTRASWLMSVLTICTMVSLPISGWISDKFRSRKLICVTPMILLMLVWPATLFVGKNSFLPLVAAIGILSGFVPTGVFSAGIEAVVDERLAGMAMAVILIGQNAGMLLGPLGFGWIVEATKNWQIPFFMLIPVCACGAVAGWMAKIR